MLLDGAKINVKLQCAERKMLYGFTFKKKKSWLLAAAQHFCRG